MSTVQILLRLKGEKSATRRRAQDEREVVDDDVVGTGRRVELDQVQRHDQTPSRRALPEKFPATDPVPPGAKKADVVERPEAFDHVGLLDNGPPGVTGLPFS